MAEPLPPIHFEDIPLAQARILGRSPRMDPELYRAFKEKIQSLDTTATRLVLPEGTTLTTMKNRLLRMAADLGVPVTIRKVTGGLLFWRSTDEDVQLAKTVMVTPTISATSSSSSGKRIVPKKIGVNTSDPSAIVQVA